MHTQTQLSTCTHTHMHMFRQDEEKALNQQCNVHSHMWRGTLLFSSPLLPFLSPLCVSAEGKVMSLLWKWDNEMKKREAHLRLLLLAHSSSASFFSLLTFSYQEAVCVCVWVSVPADGWMVGEVQGSDITPGDAHLCKFNILTHRFMTTFAQHLQQQHLITSACRANKQVILE